MKAFIINLTFFLAISHGIHGYTAQSNRKSAAFDKALIDGDVEAIQKIISFDAIFMLEYQRTLRGTEHLQHYYSTLFDRQKVKSINRAISETILLDDYVIEMGTFIKVFLRTSDNIEITHEGKFWFIWKKVGEESLLFSYAEGYHQELPRDEYVVVDIGIEPKNNGTLELKAYAAYSEKAIKEWNASMRIDLYTDDAIFYPFADKAKIGINVLEPYFKSYHRLDIQIDYIKGVPFEYIYFEGYVLQFSAFEVDWHFNEASGTNQGKGIKFWKRQPDKSLKIYRQIALHNELNP